ncbi:helix-turn-helix domain-containing protein [Chryseobacterium pennae]|uniref:helix-turn-helix domain-containing protein n=1 Tax=Chryseobacterium pennae TaxID=2258962 RepID=UPI001E3E24CF|nr:hypothetical protein [Chryseobacterium pennae]
MFYLLLFCIFDNEKLSQRTLEDTFNSSGFKALFGLGEEEKVRRSSISERLSKIDSNYFKEIYEQMYERFSSLYDKSEIEKYNLIRVDSTIVADTCSKLKEGIDQKSGKKLVKFSFSFDGILPSAVEIFTGQKYSAEDNALAEAVLSQVKKEEHHDNIYVIDRGLQSTRTMKYEALIDKIESKSDESLKVKNKVSITDDTLEKILESLATFEKNNEFTNKDTSLPKLAHQLGTNTTYLSEVIRQHKNTNFNNYINGLRIKYIIQLLYDNAVLGNTRSVISLKNLDFPPEKYLLLHSRKREEFLRLIL